MKRAFIVSGGLDSTVLCYKYSNPDDLAVTFNYGQRHSKEIEFAKKTVEILGLKHVIIPIQLGDYLNNNSLTELSKQVPEGHYAESSMKSTIVPNRNLIMLSIATAIAIDNKITEVYYGAHAGDHYIYPDCRPEFIKSLNETLNIGNDDEIKVIAPFSELTKADICEIGYELCVDFQLTWSCYKGGQLHCGKCGTCYERKEAFKLTNLLDRTEYE